MKPIYLPGRDAPKVSKAPRATTPRPTIQLSTRALLRSAQGYAHQKTDFVTGGAALVLSAKRSWLAQHTCDLAHRGLAHRGGTSPRAGWESV